MFKADKHELINVETTFYSVNFPQGARAWLTDDGKAAIFNLPRKS